MKSQEPEVDNEEQEDPTPANGVTVPEEFQQATHELLKKATSKDHLAHIRDRVYSKEDELRQAEMSKKGKSKKGADITYSTDSMPVGD